MLSDIVSVMSLPGDIFGWDNSIVNYDSGEHCESDVKVNSVFIGV